MENAILIKNLYVTKRYGTQRLLSKVVGNLEAPIVCCKTGPSGTFVRQPGSDRPR